MAADTKAAGLRAAARKLRREAAWHEQHKYDPRPPAPPDWKNTCYERAYICIEAANWCTAEARKLERAKEGK